MVRCVIDTAYTGFLLLPRLLAEELDLSPAGSAVLVLADGTRRRVPVFAAWVHWLPHRRLMLVDATDGPDALIGAGMLFPHRLRIDYTAGMVEIS